MLTDNHEYAFFDDPLDHSLGNPLCYQSDSPMDHNNVTHEKVLLIDNISLMLNKRPHVSLSLLLSSSRSTKWHHFGAILKFRHLSLMSSDVGRGPKHVRDTFYSKRRTTDKFQNDWKQKFQSDNFEWQAHNCMSDTLNDTQWHSRTLHNTPRHVWQKLKKMIHWIPGLVNFS